MARRLENKIVGATNWQDEIESKNLLKLGYCNLSFTNKENTLEPVIKALGSVEVDGSIFKFDADTVITGTYPEEGWVVVDNLGVPSFVDGGSIPDFDNDKQGFYFSTGERIVLRLRYNYKVPISDKLSWSLYNQDKKLKSLTTKDWIRTAAPLSRSWGGITYEQGLFVAVGRTGGTTTSVMTSPDGDTWTTRTTPSDSELYDITFANGLFVAVGGNSNILHSRILTSPDATTWTTRYTSTSNGFLGCVAYGNGVFVAIGGQVETIITSYDGITWTKQDDTPSGFGFRDIAFGNGIFVASRSSTLIGGTLESGVMTSPDGITWTDRETPDDNWATVAYGNGLFVSISSMTTNYITSIDGITWTERDHGFLRSWWDIIYKNNMFVVCGGLQISFPSGDPVAGQTVNNILTSFDGINWIEREAPLNDTDWYRVAYGNNKFVGIGFESSAEKILTSKLKV